MAAEKGLTQKEAEKLIEKHGKNEIKDVARTSYMKIALRQIKNNFIVYLLVAATIISFMVGKSITAYTIIVVILFVIVVGFVQEFRAEKAVKALKDMLMPISIVIRDGKETDLPSSSIVPGDIVILRSGEKVPADCVVIKANDLFVNESVLTGESKELEKKAASSSKYGEENLIYMGTFIVNGKCVAKVIDTGMRTKFGKISNLISTAEKELPLQNKINKITKYMTFVALGVSIFTGILMMLRAETLNNENLIEILILVIALSVSAFPEGFPVVLITTLAAGSYRMAQKNAIVNRMSIIETLGETTIICSDKTGTITKGEMTVNKIFADNKIIDVTGTGYEGHGDFFIDGKKSSAQNNDILKKIIEASIICNESRIERTGEDKIYSVFGSPTEASLLVMGAKAGIFKEDIKYEIINEVPFSSERKMMSVLCDVKRSKMIYSKGAPEVVLKKCEYVERKDGVFRMTDKERKRILDENKKLTSETFRTLAVAYKKYTGEYEESLIFLGIVGIRDPPREEVPEAISMCKGAGIKVKMITGDNKDTAVTIAKLVGIEGMVLEGSEMDKMTDKEISKVIDRIAVFARVRPEHKLRIVKILKERGEIVTMTGDGVNDAPALKEAHIGVAMGKNGTDVSRSVSDLTLKDDNFVTIVNAIKEGRTIFKNIRKFVSYQLSCNIAELSILFFGVLLAPALGWQVPVLLALQILFMNLVTDNLPAIMLGFNPSSKDSMTERPRRNARILNRNVSYLVAFNGALMAVFTLLTYFFAFNVFGENLDYARTTAFVSLIFIEIAAAFQFRSFRKRVFNRSPWTNKYLFFASLISIAATVFIIYFEPAAKIFGAVALKPLDWIIAIGFSLLLVVIYDILKKVNDRKNFIELEYD